MRRSPTLPDPFLPVRTPTGTLNQGGDTFAPLEIESVKYLKMDDNVYSRVFKKLLTDKKQKRVSCIECCPGNDQLCPTKYAGYAFISHAPP